MGMQRIGHSMRASALRVTLLALLILASGIACTRQNSLRDEAPEIQAELLVLPLTPQVGPAQISVRLSDTSGALVRDAVLELKGDMTHPGMTPVLAEAVERPEGLYVASMEWSMAGDWILTLQGKLSDGRTLVRQYAITVLGPEAGSRDR